MTKVINMTQNCVNEVKYCSRSVFDEGHTLQHGLKRDTVDFHDMSPLKEHTSVFPYSTLFFPLLRRVDTDLSHLDDVSSCGQ